MPAAFAKRHLEALRWSFQRARVDRRGSLYETAGPGSSRVLFISHCHRISASQTYPFFSFRNEIAARFDARLAEIRIEAFEALAPQAIPRADVVCFQTWFDIEPARLRALIERIHQHCRPRRLIYLDSFAPTDLRLAEAIDSGVDLYLKKHLLRDRARYGKATRGETNLMDYYGRRYGLDFPETLHAIPDGFLAKLRVAPSFATAPYIMPRFSGGQRSAGRRPIDVHARLGVRGTDWYEAMRGESIEALAPLVGRKILTDFGINHRSYMRELGQSKICYSPFGYGEVAWRDYEAIVSGSLLLKPDMSHCETEPDVFLPGETYAPIAWDFCDAAETIDYYLEHEDERLAIVQRAFAKLETYFARGGEAFLDQMAAIFEP